MKTETYLVATTTVTRLTTLLEALPYHMAEKRHDKRLSLRQAATAIGISHAAVDAIERGGDLKVSIAIKIIRWLYSPNKVPGIREP